MHVLLNTFTMTIIIFLIVWRCVIVGSAVSIKTLNEVIETSFLITHNGDQPFDEQINAGLIQCHGYFLKTPLLDLLDDNLSNFVELIVSIGFTKVHNFLKKSFKKKPNDFWNSLKESIANISFETRIVPEILCQTITGSQDNRISCASSSSSKLSRSMFDDSNGAALGLKLFPSCLSNQDKYHRWERFYNEEQRREFLEIEEEQIWREMPKRKKIMAQAERVGAALLYTLIHMEMSKLFENKQVKSESSSSSWSAKSVRALSQLREKFKRVEKTAVSRRANSESSSRHSNHANDNDEACCSHGNNNNVNYNNENDTENSGVETNTNINNEKGVIADKIYFPFWVRNAEKAFRMRFETEKEKLLADLEKIPHREFNNVIECVDKWENMIMRDVK
ncbi:hypothetical protein niasHT_023113 [Heterodera trifolii]|uniref:Uncharacterized protein n=1 Tax=Heterodera trifolii TaxID=157864 RepID=A0ABD2KFF8_9BILA